MAQASVHKEITEKIKNKKRRWYFLWRNGINNTKYKFEGLSEDDFIEKYLDGDRQFFERCKLWETTEVYQNMQNYYYEYMSNLDFITMYKNVREKALQGDEKAIKTFLMLQKELKHKNKNIEDNELEIE